MKVLDMQEIEQVSGGFSLVEFMRVGIPVEPVWVPHVYSFASLQTPFVGGAVE